MTESTTTAPFAPSDIVTVVEARSAFEGEDGQVVSVAGDVVMVRFAGVPLSFGVNELALTDTVRCGSSLGEDQCGEPAVATDVKTGYGICAECAEYRRQHSPRTERGVTYH